MGVRKRLRSLTKSDMLSSIRDVLEKGYQLFKRKLEDYGVDTYKTVGAIGIYLRMREKFNRIENLLKSEGPPNYESIKDNINDIFVLGAVLMAMLEKELADIDELKRQYKVIMGEDEE